MMSNVHHALGAVLVCIGLLPAAGHSMDQPHCSIASVQLGPLTKSLPMDEPQYVEGRVEVVCSSTGAEPHMMEFGLIEVGNEPHRGIPADAPTTSAPAGLKVVLFSDGAGRQALPFDATVLKHYPTRQMIPGSSNARLSIPFYARVVAQQLLGAGDYTFTRGIGVVYRISPAV